MCHANIVTCDHHNASMNDITQVQYYMVAPDITDVQDYIGCPDITEVQDYIGCL